MPQITFSEPWILALLIPLMGSAWWLHRRSMVGLPTNRARLSLVLRLVMLALLVVAAAGPLGSLPSRALNVLFLLDRSASIPTGALKQQIELVNDIGSRLPPHVQAGVAAFGREAYGESAPVRPQHVGRLHTVVDSSSTDVAAALRLGQALLPEDAERRLVLVTDGNETQSEALTEAALLSGSGIQVDVVPITYQHGQEALLQKLIAPERAKRGEPLELRFIARSTVVGPARVRLLRDGAQVAQFNWDLRIGANTITTSQMIAEPGFHTWEAILEPAKDTEAQNNRALAFTYVQGRPQVLLIEGQPGDGKLLAGVLQGRGLTVDRQGPAGVPAAIAELQRYDSVILANVRADQVTPAAMGLLRSGARDLGIGLVMVGGGQSLTAGGWRGTPVEEALPVEMEVRRPKELPALGLVLVIDTSGSMGADFNGTDKLASARAAAGAAVEALGPQDEVGVLAFSDAPEWVVPLRRLADPEAARRGISSLGAGGGTDLYRALDEAYEVLRSSKAAVRHIVALTDGNSIPGDFVALSGKLRNARITVSTVGVGQDTDRKLLARIAQLTAGRFYDEARPDSLRFIFDREARLASGAALIEQPFTPRVVSATEALRGLPAPPPLRGYVGVIARDAPGVEVPIVSNFGDPVLALRRFGLGRTAAVTTDADARWAAPWISQGNYFERFWTQLIRYSLRTTDASPLDAAMSLEGGVGRVRVDATTVDGGYRNGMQLTARVSGPTGGQEIRLDQVAPGRYEGKFAAGPSGQYLAGITAIGDPERKGITVVGASAPYSPEFRSLTSDSALLLSVAERTGGKAWPSLGAGLSRELIPGLFRPSEPARTAAREIWHWFALAAMLLLPVDIAVRRVLLPRKDLAEAVALLFAPVLARLPRRARPAAREESMNRLLEARSRAHVPKSDVTPVPPPVRSTSSAASRSGTPAAPAKPPASPASSSAPKTAPVDESTTGRLLSAKRRAAERDANGKDQT